MKKRKRFITGLPPAPASGQTGTRTRSVWSGGPVHARCDLGGQDRGDPFRVKEWGLRRRPCSGEKPQPTALAWRARVPPSPRHGSAGSPTWRGAHGSAEWEPGILGRGPPGLGGLHGRSRLRKGVGGEGGDRWAWGEKSVTAPKETHTPQVTRGFRRAPPSPMQAAATLGPCWAAGALALKQKRRNTALPPPPAVTERRTLSRRAGTRRVTLASPQASPHPWLHPYLGTLGNFSGGQPGDDFSSPSHAHPC